jgi:transglutaminase-like putative cysteine protease
MLALMKMKLSSLLILLLLISGCRVAGKDNNIAATLSPKHSSSQVYLVSQHLSLVNIGQQKPEKHNLWVALIGDQAPYQEVLTRDIHPDSYTVVIDEYGNHYAEFDLKDLDPQTNVQITIEYEVKVQGQAYDLGDCQGDLPDEYTQPELHIESNNPQIVSLAAEIAGPNLSPCEQIRRFYDYLDDNLIYTYNGQDWGAQAALGEMGADCTEYSSLLIALSRANGVPARYVEGLLYLDTTTSTEARTEHAWVEVYLPGTGWVPVDPTLGRSTLTREQHFARYTPNHIIVTNGRHPSTLRGASYWTHLYWPGNSTTIRIDEASWKITPVTSSK